MEENSQLSKKKYYRLFPFWMHLSALLIVTGLIVSCSANKVGDHIQPVFAPTKVVISEIPRATLTATIEPTLTSTPILSPTPTGTLMPAATRRAALPIPDLSYQFEGILEWPVKLEPSISPVFNEITGGGLLENNMNRAETLSVVTPNVGYQEALGQVEAWGRTSGIYQEFLHSSRCGQHEGLQNIAIVFDHFSSNEGAQAALDSIAQYPTRRFTDLRMTTNPPEQIGNFSQTSYFSQEPTCSSHSILQGVKIDFVRNNYLVTVMISSANGRVSEQDMEQFGAYFAKTIDVKMVLEIVQS